MWDKLACFIGYHSWRWKLPNDEPLDLNSRPPQYAMCDHCGITFGKNKPTLNSRKYVTKSEKEKRKAKVLKTNFK